MLRKIRSGPQRNVTKTLCDIFNDHLLYLKSMCDENRLVRIFGDKYKHNSLINEELGNKNVNVLFFRQKNKRTYFYKKKYSCPNLLSFCSSV